MKRAEVKYDVKHYGMSSFFKQCEEYCRDHVCTMHESNNRKKCELSRCIMELEQCDFKKVIKDDPFIDWSEVPINTEIYVKYCEDDQDWWPRHFAGYSSGRVFTFPDGKSQFTAQGDDERECWEFAQIEEHPIFKEGKE